jgi:hypothetical protein
VGGERTQAEGRLNGTPNMRAIGSSPASGYSQQGIVKAALKLAGIRRRVRPQIRQMPRQSRNSPGPAQEVQAPMQHQPNGLSTERLRALVADVVGRQLDLEVTVSKQLRQLGAAVERLDEAVSERPQNLRGRLLENEGGGP